MTPVDALDRLEAFYNCADCNSSFWRNLSPDMTCTTCSTRNPPTTEYVTAAGVVVAVYSCSVCHTQRQASFAIEKKCGTCDKLVPPVDASLAVGAVHAWCDACNRASYEVNATLGDFIRCRRCSQSLRPTVICSDHKRARTRALGITVIDRVQSAMHQPVLSAPRRSPCSSPIAHS